MESLITEHGIYNGFVENEAPHGKGTKNYNIGCSIEGYWVKGRPEGMATFSTNELSVMISFKSGVVKKIITEITSLTIRFPYQFILAGGNYKEVIDESQTGYYSVLQGQSRLEMFQHVMNRPLGPIASIDTLVGPYIGEYNQLNQPHGYGILYKQLSVYLGNFQNGFRQGFGYCLVNNLKLFKGEFFLDQIISFGQEKVLETNFKFIGSFKCFIRDGCFKVLFCNFKIECKYNMGKLINPVRFYKDDKFLTECSIDPLSLIPYNSHNNCNEMKEYIQLACDVQRISYKYDEISMKDKDIHRISSSLNKNDVKMQKKLPRVILPEDFNWIVYENRIFLFFHDCQRTIFDEVQRKVLKNGDVVKGCLNMDNLKGSGKYFYQNNDCYIGMLEMGKRNGLGVYLKKGKMYFRGYWKSNKFHGRGELILPEYKISGIWEDGKILKILKIICF